MRTLLASLLALALSPCTLPAQGVLPLSGTWQICDITPETFASSCTPGAPLHAVSTDGTVTFQVGGGWALSGTEFDVCPGSICISSPTSESGTYQVGTDGVVTFDDDPVAPEEIGVGFLRSDASVIFFARNNEEEDEPYLSVAVAPSSGLGAASLQDEYGFVRLVLRNDASAQTLRGDEGTIAFNGSGGFTETSLQHAVAWNGPATAATQFSGNGTYAVAPDGTVTIGGGGGRGAVSPDLEFVYWVRQACPEVEMTMAVRKPAPGAPAFVGGDWRIGSVEADVTYTAWPTFPAPACALGSDWGTITLTPQGASGGSLAPSVRRVSTLTRPSGTVTQELTVLPDAYTLGPRGRLVLFSQGTQRVPVPGWVSRDGTVFVGAPWLAAPPAPSPGCGLVLGLSRCAFPARVGAGAPGLGGISPLLLSIGGFPHVGNGAFGYVVAAGRGGAPGALLLSSAPLASGFPFLGITLWVDPTRLLTTLPLALSGPPNAPGFGAAGWSLSLAQQPPFLAGARLAAQAVLVDAAAARGLSATAGLDVAICR